MNSEDLLIQCENENLGLVIATVLDDHKKHIEAHTYYLTINNKAMHLLNHIKEHINLLQNQDPSIIPISLDDVIKNSGKF